MTVKGRRKILTELNKIARTRAKALKEAGYSGEMTEPPTVNASKVDSANLIRSIEDLQIYTRSKISTVEGMEEFVDSTLSTLHSNGYDFIDEYNLAQFGRFMNSVREKHTAKSFPSNEVAKLYENMERLGVSPRVMETHFKGYLASQEGIGDLMETLEELDLPENRKRISSTEIKEKMGELGLW